mmetsp:Transcript_7783/g.25653  ORF Transcript_7783/g.25653 Transcript_7783/m.25653 type:complete len:234 (-) Transcript_7783:35-736(-)
MQVESGQKGSKRGTPSTLTPGSSTAHSSPTEVRTASTTPRSRPAKACGLSCGWKCRKQDFMSLSPHTITTASTRSPCAPQRATSDCTCGMSRSVRVPTSAPVSPRASQPTSTPSRPESSSATRRGSVGPSPASASQPTPVTSESPRKMMLRRVPLLRRAAAEAVPEVGPVASGGSWKLKRTYATWHATTPAVPPRAAPAARNAERRSCRERSMYVLSPCRCSSFAVTCSGMAG